MQNNPIVQQIVETLRGANNVLITVKNSPSVDELTASIALTLILNHMNKHATTVFSGRVPSTIEFLQPEMAIETTTDSLRDFIIALDKSKADKLRYKVEDNVVRIFITPYRSSISEEDLEFSQGDFNVDVVVALGVLNKDDFDQAVLAHGRILHDATVIAINNQQVPNEVGAISWQDPHASSISEMVAGISELFGQGVVDGQVATALMTGIVAETDRFKNQKTTPEVLSISAMLMSAGANQQLIAEELENPSYDNPMQPLREDAQSQEDGTLTVMHEDPGVVQEIQIDEHGNMVPFGGVQPDTSLQAPLPMQHEQFVDVPNEGDALDQNMVQDGSIDHSQDDQEFDDQEPFTGQSQPESQSDFVGQAAPGELPAAQQFNDEQDLLSQDDQLPNVSSGQGRQFVSDHPIATQPINSNIDGAPLFSEPTGMFNSGASTQPAPAFGQDEEASHKHKVIQPLEAPLPDEDPLPSAMQYEVAGDPMQSSSLPPVVDQSQAGSNVGDYQTVVTPSSEGTQPQTYMPPENHAATSSAGTASQSTQSTDDEYDLPQSPQTLEDIERSVHSPHIDAAVHLPVPDSGFLGGAQPQAQSAPTLPQPQPEPVVTPSLQPAEVTPVVQNPTAAPAVPPPIMPMPQASSSTMPQFYEADGSKSNPFSNPA